MVSVAPATGYRLSSSEDEQQDAASRGGRSGGGTPSQDRLAHPTTFVPLDTTPIQISSLSMDWGVHANSRLSPAQPRGFAAAQQTSLAKREALPPPAVVGRALEPPSPSHGEGTALGQALFEYQDDAEALPGMDDPLVGNADDKPFLARHSLRAECAVEFSQLGCNQVHKVWALIKVTALPSLPRPLPDVRMGPMAGASKRPAILPGVDFVVAIDRSTSMRLDNKLAFVQATIAYLVSQLTERQRFCLITFNQQVDFVTSGLVPMTADNKAEVLASLHRLTAEGSTNISEALTTCLAVLRSRDFLEQKTRIGSVMLFTDGLANAGARGSDFKATLANVKQSLDPDAGSTPIPDRERHPQMYNTTINTFGFGVDHDSQMLQEIAFTSRGGVYHYIETVESIPATFGSVLDGITSTVAHSIEVTLEAADGCRMVNFYTRYPILELTPVKKYSVMLGSMYMGEERCILLKLSLRKMGRELLQHRLMTAEVRYVNALTGEDVFGDVLAPLYSEVVVQRPLRVSHQVPSLELDKHINRYTAAAAIEEAIKSACARDFSAAQEKLHSVIDCVLQSASAVAGDPYVEDLVEDLRECSAAMLSYDAFLAGRHTAHAFAGMYYMERSTGLDINLPETSSSSSSYGSAAAAGPQTLYSDASVLSVPDEPRQRRRRSRHPGYGYATAAQRVRALDAYVSASKAVVGYLTNS